jgi:hypothetical protein
MFTGPVRRLHLVFQYSTLNLESTLISLLYASNSYYMYSFNAPHGTRRNPTIGNGIMTRRIHFDTYSVR